VDLQQKNTTMLVTVLPVDGELFPKQRNHHDVYHRAKSNLMRATRFIANRFRVRQAYAIERGEKPAN
jgi:hypothetical protein